MKGADGEVGGAQTEQLVVGIDGVAVRLGERAAGRDRFDVGENEAGQRDRDELAEIDVRESEHRHRECRQPVGDVADDRDPEVRERIGVHQQQDRDDDGDRRGPAGEAMGQDEQHRQRREAEEHRGKVRLWELRRERRDTLEEVAGTPGDAEELRQLRRGDEQGGAGLEAGQNDAADEIHHETDADHAPDDADGADQRGRRGRQQRVARDVAVRQREQARGDQERGRRRRTDRDLFRGAEDRVGDPADEVTVQPAHRRETGERRVRDAFGDREGGERQPCDHVAAQQLAAVRRQPAQAGQIARERVDHVLAVIRPACTASVKRAKSCST